MLKSDRICFMEGEYDSIVVTDMGEGTEFCLPGNLRVKVPKATIRRSTMLWNAIHASGTASFSIRLPHGVLRDWLQSVDALKVVESADDGADLAENQRLLRFLKVRHPSFCLRLTA